MAILNFFEFFFFDLPGPGDFYAKSDPVTSRHVVRAGERDVRHRSEFGNLIDD